MDCTNTRLLLSCLHSRELDVAERAALERHLDTCSECAQLAGGERRFDEAVAIAMQQVPVPAPLKDRILAKLAQVRRPRPWGWIAAAAAAVLLAAGLGAVLLWPQSTPIDPSYQIIKDNITQPEQVQEWFTDLGVDMAPPSHFNYNLLERFDVAEVQGRRVAHLTFIYRGDQQSAQVAHVYVLPRRYFEEPDPAQWNVNDRLRTSLHNIELQNGPGHFFMILFTGESLLPFTGFGI